MALGGAWRVTAESSAVASPAQPSRASGAAPQGWHGPPGRLPRVRPGEPGQVPVGLGAPGAGPGGTSVRRGQRVNVRPGVQLGSGEAGVWSLY